MNTHTVDTYRAPFIPSQNYLVPGYNIQIPESNKTPKLCRLLNEYYICITGRYEMNITC